MRHARRLNHLRILGLEQISIDSTFVCAERFCEFYHSEFQIYITCINVLHGLQRKEKRTKHLELLRWNSTGVCAVFSITLHFVSLKSISFYMKLCFPAKFDSYDVDGTHKHFYSYLSPTFVTNQRRI